MANNRMANKLITDSTSEPLGGAKTAGIDVDSGPGRLMIDGLAVEKTVWASGILGHNRLGSSMAR